MDKSSVGQRADLWTELVQERNNIEWWTRPRRPHRYSDAEIRNHRAELLAALVGFDSPRDRRPAPNRNARREAVLENVKFLINNGEAPDIIAQRLGTTPGALAKSLHRAGHTALAMYIHRGVRKAA